MSVKMSECCGEQDGPDVRAVFPGCRIGYEDPHFQASQCIWHFIVECRYGHIAPSGKGLLWAFGKTQDARRSLRMLAEHEGCELKQDASDGVAVEFGFDRIGDVVRILKPFRS